MRTFAKFSNVNNDHAVRYSHKYDESDEEAWRSFRYFGLFASFCALGFGAVAVCSGSWVVGKGQSGQSRSGYVTSVASASKTLTNEQIFKETRPFVCLFVRCVCQGACILWVDEARCFIELKGR